MPAARVPTGILRNEAPLAQKPKEGKKIITAKMTAKEFFEQALI
jgi:hypothetical protein